MINVTEGNFQDLIDHKLAVIKIGSKTCGPCKLMERVMGDLEKDYATDEIVFGNMDVEECEELANKLNIRSIPTVIFYSKGEVVKCITGTAPRHHMDNIMQELLKHI